jgi:NTE family protein
MILETIEDPAAPGRQAAPRPFDKCVDLVFEGGGVKGIAMVGALAALESQGYKHQNLAGTSAGAIVATLLAAGYTAAELRDMIAAQDFSAFLDSDWVSRIPLIGAPINVVADQGIYKGDAFLHIMRTWLEARGVRTFGDLRYTPPEGYTDDGDERYRYKVQVIASDLTDRSFLVLPRDARNLGVEPDDLDVALAVRMSMSIPIFFEPVRFRNPKTGKVHVIVDGGVLSTYPIWLFDTEGIPEWPTFGLQLLEDQASPSVAKTRPPMSKRVMSRLGRLEGVEFLADLFFTMKDAHDRRYIEGHTIARTIPIPTLGVGITDFHLGHDVSMALYDSGRKAAEEFLAAWDFDAYIAECRLARPSAGLAGPAELRFNQGVRARARLMQEANSTA